VNTVRIAIALLVSLAAAAPAAARPAQEGTPEPPVVDQPIAWQDSRAMGLPWAGRLMDGVQLPAEGVDYFTWDPPLKRAPNREWRRWGTDRLVATLLAVLSDFRTAHPEAPRIGIGDLSRHGGGDFGKRFGGLGHASHQNGLDADVYYPRLDMLERRAFRPSQVDQRLSQELVDRFVAAGAEKVFVGPRLSLRGPRRVVMKLVHHDDHLHVRIRRR
jgi:murein endopeptidase